MKTIAKLLVMLIAVAMMASCFAACNSNTTTHQTPPPSSEQEGTTPGNHSGNTGEETTTPATDPIIMPDIVNMGGYTYKAYVRSNVPTGGNTMEDGNPAFYCEDFWVDPNAGEPEDALAYAVYHRNKQIENDYNVKIRQVSQSINMVQELERFFQDGESIP